MISRRELASGRVKRHPMSGHTLGYMTDRQYEIADLNDEARLRELFEQWVPSEAELEEMSLNTFWDEDLNLVRDALECYITAGGLKELTIFEQKRRYLELVAHVAADPEAKNVDLSINEYTEEFDGVYGRTAAFTGLRDMLDDVGIILPFSQSELDTFNTDTDGLPYPHRIEEHDLAFGIAVATERNWHGRPTTVLYYLPGKSDAERTQFNQRMGTMTWHEAALVAEQRLGDSQKFWNGPPSFDLDEDLDSV